MPRGQQRGSGAEQGVADLDVVVEEGQRLAGCHGLEPQADLGEVGGHRVEVDAVDAAGHDVVHGVAVASVGVGSISPVRTVASRVAMRRAAATMKWPLPIAGSQTGDSQQRALRGRCCFSASSSTGSSAVSRTSSTSSVGV